MNIDELVLRWTPEQRERARSIVNDIAEDIDNHESRRELRQALAIYADMLYDALQYIALNKSDELYGNIKKLTDLLEKNKHLTPHPPLP